MNRNIARNSLVNIIKFIMINVIAVVAAGNYHAQLAQARIAQRGKNKDRSPLFSEEDVRLAMRLTSQQISELQGEYNTWRRIKFGIQPVENRSAARMTAFLAYLARGGFFHQAARAEGVAKSTLMLHVKEVAEYFADTASAHISLPLAAELDGLSLPLQDQHAPQVKIHQSQVFVYCEICDGLISSHRPRPY